MNCINALMELMQVKSDDTSINNSGTITFIRELFSSCKDIKTLPMEDSKNKSLLIGVNTQLANVYGGILFSGRISTMKPSASLAPSYIKDGYIYGYGSTSMKYFTACLAQALPMLKKSPAPIIIALPFTDQSGVTGAEGIIRYMKDNNIQPDLCIVGHPTSFSFLTCNDGSYQYRLKISSKGGDARLLKELSSPFYVASDFINQIYSLNQDQDYSLVNIGVLEGGRSTSQIPKLCTIRYGIRTPSLDFKQRVDDVIEALKEKTSALGNGMSIQNIPLSNSIPLFNNTDSKWLKQLLHIANEGVPVTGLITEAGFYQEVGIDTLIFGAGDMKNARTDNEHIAISDLEKYIEMLSNILEAYNKKIAEA